MKRLGLKGNSKVGKFRLRGKDFRISKARVNIWQNFRFVVEIEARLYRFETHFQGEGQQRICNTRPSEISTKNPEPLVSQEKFSDSCPSHDRNFTLTNGIFKRISTHFLPDSLKRVRGKKKKNISCLFIYCLRRFRAAGARK